MPASEVGSLVVIGTGLIGTSVALAACARGTTVALVDTDPAAVAAAAGRGAGRPARPGDPPADLAVLAVPPDAVGPVLRAAQDRGLARVYTDVASVKAPVVAGARAAGCDLASFVPGHPMAGGERPGAGAATPKLFIGRSWALCPGPETAAPATALVRALIDLCGAVPVVLGAEAHDRAVATVSHAPHIVSSAMAAALARAAGGDLGLAGPGIRDVTRTWRQ